MIIRKEGTNYPFYWYGVSTMFPQSYYLSNHKLIRSHRNAISVFIAARVQCTVMVRSLFMNPSRLLHKLDASTPSDANEFVAESSGTIFISVQIQMLLLANKKHYPSVPSSTRTWFLEALKSQRPVFLYSLSFSIFEYSNGWVIPIITLRYHK